MPPNIGINIEGYRQEVIYPICKKKYMALRKKPVSIDRFRLEVGILVDKNKAKMKNVPTKPFDWN